MKNLRQFCAIAVLTSAFALSAFAGDISFPGATNPPPQQQSSATGDIGFPGATATGEISFPGAATLDPATEAALSLLRSLLSLF